MRHRSIVRSLFHALIAALIIGQCGASLALAVRADWHEEAHHHDGEEDHDCPVVQLAHGYWDAPHDPVWAIECPPAPTSTVTFLDTSRLCLARVIGCSLLEHAPPARG